MIIHTIRLGITNCYVIQDKGTIMVDSGPPNKLDIFIKSMQKANIDPKQIGLIINTHGHYDHIGSAKSIKDVTGARNAMHEPDKEWLEKSIIPSLKGVTTWGKVLSRLLRKPSIASTQVDVELRDEDFSLVPYGIPGIVIFTPGHTSGSVSVLLETGEAFIGDLAMSGFPLRLNPGLPIFAEDIKSVKENIKMLITKGANIFYPGHGKAFSADVLLKTIE
jgi:hydroxyacylglutathione hydrolase